MKTKLIVTTLSLALICVLIPWTMERSFLIVPSHVVVGKWLDSFKEFPVRQKPASFNLDEVMRKLSEKQGANG